MYVRNKEEPKMLGKFADESIKAHFDQQNTLIKHYLIKTPNQSTTIHYSINQIHEKLTTSPREI
ncbi:hypothetical protein HanXRQr2_Chr14g0621111 [Helianthus annuus]|uniref:Uncharacterized protein n=1 Tax=Helianthus annuus TaxID=4232 RepID=A0A9K3E521_HELAN|nr:hypothetical protein HanXRQr2_Chr14g0621111 [Helianthus annuus]